MKSDRRSFLGGLAALGLAGVAGLVLRRARKSPVALNRLRPPGAIPEGDFSSQCIRCGRCAEVCPYTSVKLLGLQAGTDAGTPLIEAEIIPCYLCMECVTVCPSGALRPIELEETRMGLAVIDPETCVALLGTLLCRTCYNVCPLQDTAIDLPAMEPRVIEEGCTGCGICVHACPVDGEDGRKAINITPAGFES